ncbi:conserved hypothetical protein [Talaromyces stipitatus ATCC 10500]|uniref:DNA (cytosine-5)-methyltransferase 1 replication foci domain-containing protein n=1 Tax=Talaromyces stipitatus (strain ATCC 10500 / CBS 375.48 / QM 6759 / NRRL 1006) TaxID=441959 RepID=B8M346_TALSN|nr:uncharacterized protein TSTA_092680 [Talaromyces stipitatus ATCC 10500]EED22022.1 conserved hypothetical protein [Talaromyces stipitatus ATCC 10500]
MTSREDQILKPRDPLLEDENEWEEFSLTDVKVLIPGKSRYANLLATSPENPVRVIGCLNEVEEEQEHLVIDENYLSKRIVIENVTHYAYGQHADGEIGVWVAGQAGWFSILPAKGYKPMFNDMVEAVDLLYFLVDRHRNQRPRRKRRGREVTFEYLCDEYVTHTNGICEDGDDSAEVFYKHSSFLLSQMIQGREEVQWNETDVFNHLVKKFPDEYERILALQQKPDDGPATEDHDGSTDKETVKVEAIPNSQADTIFGIITDLKEAGALAKRQLNLDLVVSTLRNRIDVDSEDYARDLIAARSKQVIERMDQSEFDWPKKAIYRELKQLAENADIRQIAITPLRPRTSVNDDTSSSDHEDGDDEDEDDSPRARRHRMRMSVLRPSTTKAGKKTRGGKAPAAVRDDAHLCEDSDVSAEDLDTPSKSRGHNLVRDPPPSATTLHIRARSILSDADSTSLVIRKTPLQETHQSANLSGPDAASVNHEDSSKIADGLPDDTWICPAEGCDKVICKASSKRSKELISDHTLTHAEDTQTKLDLVFAEQRLNIGLGVDNLLRRIREFGTLDGVNGDGSDVAAKRVRR